MQTFLQSAFLQALAMSLLASIWQMALLWVITIVLLKYIKLTAAQKFNIAFIAQLGGLVLFTCTFINSYNYHEERIAHAASAGNFLFIANSFIDKWMPYLSIIYLGILLFKLAGFIFSYNESKVLRTQGLKKISAESRLFVQEMSQIFSLHKKVRIYLSEKITCPLTTGLFKPIILIPAAAINHLTTEQMEAVILHELAHIKRADYLLFLLQSLTDKIFFFNIFSKMLSDIIERERENACDDWVLQFRYNSMHYAEALFKLGRLKSRPALAMLLTGKKENLLLVRIRRILHNPQNAPGYSLQPLLLGLFSVIMAAGLFVSSSTKPINISPAVTQTVKEKMMITGNPVSVNKAAVVQSALKDENLQAEPQLAAVKPAKKCSPDIESNTVSIAKADKAEKQRVEHAEYNDIINAFPSNQNYLVNVQHSLDSLQVTLPDYTQAINSQVVVTPEVLQKAVSYQNFKQIERMLAASGNYITVTEADATKNSYQKQITIEARDKKGDKHVYTVVVQLYQ
ncbi:MAG TPA: M56 family metallopeptidase [Parafilimonas sp.]|nr:M56 family metallopeptidase [Parafilimonas sp.]